MNPALREKIPVEHQPRVTCNGCPFRGPKVGSKGDVTSNLVIVGESPGTKECATGIPFSGPSGELLHRLIPEGRAYVLNALECSPIKKQGKKDEAAMDAATRCCNPRLVEQVTSHPRRLIVALGNPAVRSLTGMYGLKITQIRGRLIQSPLSELGILPVVHPAALMRGTGSYRQFRNDLAYALEMADGKPPRPYVKPNYVWIKDPRELIARLRQMLEHTNDLTCDIETQGFSHRHHEILSIGIAQDDKPDDVICFDGDLLPVVKRYLESPHIKWCWHNGKFDVKFLWAEGIKARVDDDTMLMSYALDEQKGIHDLETVSLDVLNCPDYKHVIEPYRLLADRTQKKGRKNKKKNRFTDLSPHHFMYEKDAEGLMDYMSIDSGNTSKIRTIYRERIRQDKSTNKLYTKTLIPASQLIAEVEYNGIHVDQDWLNSIDASVGADVTTSRNRILEITGRPELNPNSPKQMQDVLFRQFKLPNRSNGSTNKDVMKKLLENASTRLPIVRALQDYRKASKLYSTYIVGMRVHIQDDGRVYATFKLHGTITGRLASSDPNMQNIPRDPRIRGIFAPAPGYIFVEVDLSQAELRSLAALSGDPVMIDLYNAGRDIHTELARFLFPGWDEREAAPKGSPEKIQAKEERTKCKNVNFGIVYGITEFGLQDQIGGTLDECRAMIEGWGNRFPVAWEFIEKCRMAPRKGQTITTHFGRKKRVGIVTPENIGFLENESANFPHQSIASDITLHAAMRTKDQLRGMGVRIVNLIHDAVLMEVPVKEGEWQLARDVAMLVGRQMAQVPKDWGIKSVPFLASAGMGERWGALSEQEEWNNELKITA
jgi:uracil-DNA glycosylase family 4